nr:hypothetical protein [Allomuricauda ochracea]
MDFFSSINRNYSANLINVLEALFCTLDFKPTPTGQISFILEVNRNKYAVAFYNLENFFDTNDDSHTLDDDFTPKGFKNGILQNSRKRQKRWVKPFQKLVWKIQVALLRWLVLRRSKTKW